MSPALRHVLIAPPDAVYPVLVHVSVTGAEPVARVARVPLTYSCRVLSPAGTGADQMFFAASNWVQPLTRTAPDSTGRAPEAAVQMTLCPLVPESLAPRVSGALSWYVPLASCTLTSPVMAPLTPRTRAWARARVRTGLDEEVPEL